MPKRIAFPTPWKHEEAPWTVAAILDVALYGGYFRTAGPRTTAPDSRYAFADRAAKKLATSFSRYFRGDFVPGRKS